MGNNMNEKIKEQADEYAWKQFPDTTTYPHPADWQVIREGKFAESIIKETIKIIQATAAESIDLDRTLVENVSWTLNDIKKHFGVE